MVAVVESLAANSVLEMLLIAENPFGDECSSAIISTLCKSNMTLKVLDIHGSRMNIDVEKQVESWLSVFMMAPLSHPTHFLCNPQVVHELEKQGHLVKLGSRFAQLKSTRHGSGAPGSSHAKLLYRTPAYSHLSSSCRSHEKTSIEKTRRYL